LVERRDKSISLWFTFSVIWTDMIARESGIHRLAVDLEEMRFGAHIASNEVWCPHSQFQETQRPPVHVQTLSTCPSHPDTLAFWIFFCQVNFLFCCSLRMESFPLMSL